MKSSKEFRIEGMDCADCARHVQDAVRKIEGIQEVQVNFVNGKMTLRTSGQFPADQRIINAVKKTGYQAFSISNASDGVISKKWMLLVLSAFLFNDWCDPAYSSLRDHTYQNCYYTGHSYWGVTDCKKSNS